VFSLWGFVMLLVVGSLLAANYQPIHLNDLTASQSVDAASGAYAAAGIYGGLVILCGVRWAYIIWQEKRNAQFVSV
jgi:hypothetical protein